MADRFNRDPGPDPRAVAYLEAKGLERSWRWSSTWNEQHAFGFTLAGVYRLDVLAAAQNLTTKAVRDGESFETFRKGFEARLNALGFAGPQVVTEFEEGPRDVELTASWRLKTIYRANVSTAYAASEWQAIDDTKADFPALEYQGVKDEATRTTHEELFGVVRLVSDPFWATWYPPNDWGCRCWVVQISVDELASGAIKLTTDVDLKNRGVVLDEAQWPIWTDKNTGMIARVPEGIGPGWAYNPGMARRQVLGELLARRIAGLDPNMARAAAADLVNFPQFADLVTDAVALGKLRADRREEVFAQLRRDGVPRAQADRRAAAAVDDAGKFPADSWPIAVTPPELGEQARGVVVVNASAIGHSADKHPTTPADWDRARQLLEDGEIWRASDGEVTVFGSFETNAGRRLWALALKAVDGAWRVRTFFPTSPRRRSTITNGRELVRAARGDLAKGME